MITHQYRNRPASPWWLAAMKVCGLGLVQTKLFFMTLLATIFTVGVVVGNIIPGDSPNWPILEAGGARGDSTNPFFGERPIARWSTVSFQSYSKPFPVGLVAFHGCGQALGNEGIEKVEFIANNGQVAIVTEPTPNPETGRWEWWTYLDPTAIDGAVEVRAIVYPYCGLPRILQGGFTEKLEWGQIVPNNEQSVVLWSNQLNTLTKPDMWVSTLGNDETGDGTQVNPFRSIGAAVYKGYNGNADFGRVLLTKGIYPMHNQSQDAYLNDKGWFVIESAPGVNRKDVTIGGNTEEDAFTRYRTICFRNLSFDYKMTPSKPTVVSPSINKTTNVWLDGVSVNGTNPSCSYSYYFQGVNLLAVTSNKNQRVRWSNFNSGPRASIVMGVDVSNCSGDVFTANSLVRDWTVTDTVMLPADHPDLWQSFGSNPNRILMDGKIVGGDIQLIFLDATLFSNTDLAMVNIVMAAKGGGVGQIGAPLRNVLMWNVELTGQNLAIPQSVGSAPTFGMFGSIISQVGFGSDQKPKSYQWTCNQFAKAPSIGTLSSVLDPKYTSGFVATNPIEISKRTVRWGLDQKERTIPYRCGAFSTSDLSILPELEAKKTPEPVRGLRIVR